MTSGSGEKICMILFEKVNTITPNDTTMPIDITKEALTPSFTRLNSFAPKFCPQNVVIASIKLLTGNPKKLSILFAQEYPATPEEPKRLIYAITIKLEKETIIPCTPAGTPISTIFFNISLSILNLDIDTLYSFLVPNNTNSTRNILTASLIIVAHAAPATPIFKLCTKNKSKNIFSTDVAIKKYNGLLESPTACKIPVPALYTVKNIEPRK